MNDYMVKAKSFSQVKAQSEPQAVPGGQSETLKWQFYDTVDYVSGTSTELTFFTTSRATRELTNMKSPGQLPEPQYFEIHNWMLDAQIPPSPTAWADLDLLLKGGTSGMPTWEFSLADKGYGRFPLTTLHESGGLRGYGLSRADATATPLVVANNAFPDGGWSSEGTILIPPKQGFSVTLRWSSAVAPTLDPIPLRVTMCGILYRRVL